MKFLVLGLGSIGRRHASILKEFGHEVYGYNRGEARRKFAEAELDLPMYADLDQALESEAWDMVLVCTPNSLHVEHALAVVRRGLGLFIEKPLSHDMAGVNELVGMVREKNIFTHIGSNMRHHAGVMSVKEACDSGQLGRILSAQLWGGMYLPDWHPGEEYRNMYSARKDMGGGAVLDFIHELDLARWFFGDPEAVVAMTANTGWLGIDTEETVDAVLRYPSGVLVNVHLDYLHLPSQRGIRIMGEKGSACWDLAQEKVEFFDLETRRQQEIVYPENRAKPEMYVRQLGYVIDRLQAGEPSDCDLEAGVSALRLALDIKRSSSESRFIYSG